LKQQASTPNVIATTITSAKNDGPANRTGCVGFMKHGHLSKIGAWQVANHLPSNLHSVVGSTNSQLA
jgi:hypothetical protein